MTIDPTERGLRFDPMKKVPAVEKELIESEFLWLGARLLKVGLTVPQVRTYMRTRLDVL